MPALVARLACGVFFGAALYIGVVQQPAALAVGSGFAARFFAPMYERAAVLQVTAALVGTTAGAWACGGARWLAGATLLFAVVPLTLLWILPVTERLLSPDLDPDAPATAALLAQWAWRHAARAALSGVAFVLYLLAGPRP